jgi:hypothetical protein
LVLSDQCSSAFSIVNVAFQEINVKNLEKPNFLGFILLKDFYLIDLKLEDFSVLCNDIFGINEKIRFVGIIDQMGKLIAGDMKDGLPSLERDDGSIRLYLGYAINNVLRRDFDNVFGKVLYTFSEREKIKLLTVPIDNNLLLVSMDISSDHVELINKIQQIVSKLTKV